MAHTPTAGPSEPSAFANEEVDLAIASLAIHATLFPLACYIAWKHGKFGMVSWPIFATFFVIRFVSTGWKISHRDDPKLLNSASSFTAGGLLSCLTLTLIGIVYEIGIIIPEAAASPKKNKTLLGLTHLVMAVGVGITSYGGAPRPDAPDGIASTTVNKMGHFLMLLVITVLAAWIVFTGRRIAACRNHVQFRNAKILLLTASAGLPFQGVRLISASVYALARTPGLDPDTGTFTTKLVLVFLVELAVAIILCAGGWLSRAVKNPGTTSEPRDGSVDGKETAVWRVTELGVAQSHD
ncbi:hypothetical protein C2857_002630 [Epichloe festucae Fl1]|uniref:DUF7702 domain-containing protein n=1 Tax=Epichloe festucae (strain Fl1) TaxID=877507 RepID=A0A7S9KNM0_EPIFF|nr:hypothetical protein C2857_002630 [Epichloe festucae Fl1]